MTYKSPLATTTNFGLVQVGTGISVANGVISGSTGLLNYGFFSDGTQTNPVANTVNIASFGISGPTNGITVVGGNALTVANAGIYTMSYTLNMNKTSGGTSGISIWLRQNGTDIPGSSQSLDLINTLSTIFVSGNFTVSMAAGDNIQLCWSSADTTVSLLAIPAAVGPVRPTGASVKMTLTRIS